METQFYLINNKFMSDPFGDPENTTFSDTTTLMLFIQAHYMSHIYDESYKTHVRRLNDISMTSRAKKIRRAREHVE